MASGAIVLGAESVVTAWDGVSAGGGFPEGRRRRARGREKITAGRSPRSNGSPSKLSCPDARLSWSADVGTATRARQLFLPASKTSGSRRGSVAASLATAAASASTPGKRNACPAGRRGLHPPPLERARAYRFSSLDRDGASASPSASAFAAASSKFHLENGPAGHCPLCRCPFCLLRDGRTLATSRRCGSTPSGSSRNVMMPAATAVRPIFTEDATRMVAITAAASGVDDKLVGPGRPFGGGGKLVGKNRGRMPRSCKKSLGGARTGKVGQLGGHGSRSSQQPLSGPAPSDDEIDGVHCKASSSSTRGRAGRYSKEEEDDDEDDDGDDDDDDDDEEEEEEEVIVGRREAYVDDADFDLDFGDDVLGEKDEYDDYAGAAMGMAGETGEDGIGGGDESLRSLRALLEEAGVQPKYVLGSAEVVVTGISVDSRTTNPGDVFVCIVGNKTDGHLHVAEAVEKGAVAVVASREEEVVLDGERVKALVIVEDTSKVVSGLSSAVYRHPSRQMAVIGVTGTNGKTTTTYLLRGMYNAMGLETGLIGTINHFVGKKKLDSSITTPDAAPLHRLMRDMVDAGVSACVMEVSSHGLKLGRVDDVDFDVAVFTNLTRDHMDFHKTEEDYRMSKGMLFDRMVDPGRHRKVVNLDDPNAEWFIAKGNPEVPVVTFGMDREDADVRAMEVQLSLFETEVVIRTPKGDIEVSSGLLGRHNVYNVLATVAVGIAIDAPLDDVVKGIEEVDAVPGRCELIDEEQAFAVVVDYAHTPDALGRLLDSVRECGPRRLITVVGCGGDRDRGKRPLMAKIATEKSEVTILTSDNPRTENPLDIIDDMLAGVGWSIEDYLKWGRDGFYPPLPNGHRLFVHDMRIIAVRAAVAMGEEGDAVVIAGKGHETYQIIGTEKDYFDDREECREALQHVDALHAAGIDTTEFPWRFVDQ